ncbi:MULTISPECIES: hypothetical protein [unclassified Leifsonia]|uniref:hypothetical protein n=1 Tax=unclassified Leifsonia TaxID=2663824 RepID=UPI0008A78BC4|nr:MULTISPECIES: hypothetical protein [unclassified Leifsonia]SEH56036.1 hypothetical protein SAMN04515694_10189 [Leifsonia sp. CL154]SFL22998.1 hypothetical protein SAMN04515692_101390 [Leifsonia sp. CL147]
MLYHAPLAVAQRFAQATPQEARLGLQTWIDWATELGPALVDPGQPPGQSRKVTAEGMSQGDTDVIGMSIIEAPSMDSALEMVEIHHYLRWAEGGSRTQSVVRRRC